MRSCLLAIVFLLLLVPVSAFSQDADTATADAFYRWSIPTTPYLGHGYFYVPAGSVSYVTKSSGGYRVIVTASLKQADDFSGYREFDTAFLSKPTFYLADVPYCGSLYKTMYVNNPCWSPYDDPNFDPNDPRYYETYVPVWVTVGWFTDDLSRIQVNCSPPCTGYVSSFDDFIKFVYGSSADLSLYRYHPCTTGHGYCYDRVDHYDVVPPKLPFPTDPNPASYARNMSELQVLFGSDYVKGLLPDPNIPLVGNPFDFGNKYSPSIPNLELIRSLFVNRFNDFKSEISAVFSFDTTQITNSPKDTSILYSVFGRSYSFDAHIFDPVLPYIKYVFVFLCTGYGIRVVLLSKSRWS